MSLLFIFVFEAMSVVIQRTSDDEPHPGSSEGAVPHVAGTVDALVGRFRVLHRQHGGAVHHLDPVSHVVVISCKETRKNKFVDEVEIVSALRLLAYRCTSRSHLSFGS